MTGRCLTPDDPGGYVLCSAESKRLFFVPACPAVIAARKRQGFWSGVVGLRESMAFFKPCERAARPCCRPKVPLRARRYAPGKAGRDVYPRLGLNVDYVSGDWGTVVTRRTSKAPVARGGWSTFCTYGDGQAYANPATHTAIWGNGAKGWYGWYSSDRMEALRDAWYDAPDLVAQQRIARQIQLLVWQDVPYIPIGQWFQPIARRADLTGLVRSALPIFWNVRRT
jgi:hypothetical protein